jgi:hypothetical protein
LLTAMAAEIDHAMTLTVPTTHRNSHHAKTPSDM